MSYQDTFSHTVYETTPEKDRVLLLTNDHHALLQVGQAGSKEIKDSERRLREALDEFDRNTGGHSNPSWIKVVMRANALSTLGALDESIDLHRQSLEEAVTNIELGISHNNLGEMLREVGLIQEGLIHGYKAAIHHGGNNVGTLVTYAVTLHSAGHMEVAEEILKKLNSASKAPEPRWNEIETAWKAAWEKCEEEGDLPTEEAWEKERKILARKWEIEKKAREDTWDVLKAHLDYERRFRDMVDLPVVGEMLRRFYAEEGITVPHEMQKLEPRHIVEPLAVDVPETTHISLMSVGSDRVSKQLATRDQDDPKVTLIEKKMTDNIGKAIYLISVEPAQAVLLTRALRSNTSSHERFDQIRALFGEITDANLEDAAKWVIDVAEEKRSKERMSVKNYEYDTYDREVLEQYRVNKLSSMPEDISQLNQRHAIRLSEFAKLTRLEKLGLVIPLYRKAKISQELAVQICGEEILNEIRGIGSEDIPDDVRAAKYRAMKKLRRAFLIGSTVASFALALVIGLFDGDSDGDLQTAPKQCLHGGGEINSRLIASKQCLHSSGEINSRLIASKQCLHSGGEINSRLIASKQCLHSSGEINSRLIASKQCLHSGGEINSRLIA